MESGSSHDIARVSSLFDMRANLVSFRPYGSGHINDTYCATYDQAGLKVRYIHQRINHLIFTNPVALMENVSRVTRHAHQALAESCSPDAYRRTLTCIPTISGHTHAVDDEGNTWRTYQFIEGAIGYDKVTSDAQAYQAAKAFGAFQNFAAALPGGRLHETIPNFHHTPGRLAALREAFEADPCGRAAKVAAEYDFAISREADARIVTDHLASGAIPERVTHNDTKLNNVLLDEKTSEGICVIDLDTTMPGSALYDFGDMVRTAASTAVEDATDLETVGVNILRFTALTRGYLETARFLNPLERSLLAFSGRLLTMECGMRFLTDYLLGDRYFKIAHPEHNLERCRNQFAMVSALERHAAEMEDIVETAN